ncbi:hypothetical protein CFC21_010146 [Triticum aestivum]|uniref:F-box protein AT5G49610-like beta-propeller domain-containing protein n=2 Tax=Triticum aestivum TaxID=4565 RepID=A0A9R1DJT2_WHEAT|nr:hypothetical protein CFC21_010146 [Triticum aestivum]
MEPSETSPAATTTIDSLKDDNIEDILLRLPSPASLARAALASRRWRGIASSSPFLRRFRELHPRSPILGLFASQPDLQQLPIFHPAAAVRSDPDLKAAARGGDFLLTRLEDDPAWRFRDCRNGRLLLCRGGDSLSLYDPVSHRHVAVPRPRNDEPLLPVPLPPGAAEYIWDCLLDGHGEFRVVTVQRDDQRLRAMEYASCTAEWGIHPWVDGIRMPAHAQSMRPMLAAAAGLIFWRYDRNSSLLLDTSTMAFSIVPLPVAIATQTMMPPGAYAIGDTEEGVCCLLHIVGRTTLQVWLLKKNDGDGGHAWELEKQSHIGWLDSFNRRFGVHMVAAGMAIVYCMSCKFSHFVIDLKDLSLMEKFRCHRTMAYPFQMPWPPAALVPTSPCERPTTPQTYACGDAQNQHEAPSSSRKRKSNDEAANLNKGGDQLLCV